MTTRDVEDRERLGELMRRLRRRQGLSQQDLADQLAVRQEVVSRVEVGERRLDVFELARMAHALGTTAAHIIQQLGLDEH